MNLQYSTYKTYLPYILKIHQPKTKLLKLKQWLSQNLLTTVNSRKIPLIKATETKNYVTA